ncbi:MAG: GNAT family N-acetyltransferase [Salinivenus sp.]
MSTSPTIRSATENDAETIARFNRQMAEETEGKALDPETTRRGVQAIFDNPSRGFYLVAERAGSVVASLMITTEWSDWRNGQFWWIQSVYVQPDDRRAGVYTALHRAVRRRAREATTVCGLRLYVERTNGRARDTYEALGMTQTSYRMYEEML